jgi:hypothetical protein
VNDDFHGIVTDALCVLGLSGVLSVLIFVVLISG